MKTVKADTAPIVRERDSIHETLYLLAIVGMRESIHDGMQAPVEECSDRLGW